MNTTLSRCLRRGPRRAAMCALAGSIMFGIGFASAPARAGGTWYVDVTNPACHDTATGTATDPYCSISAALAAHHAPGTTILVMAGVYPERVSIPASGLEGQPLVISGSPGAIVDGADDFSDPALWQRVQGPVWLAASVTWPPSQVFADGARLTPWTGTPTSPAANSFSYVAGTGLYVNTGGGSPSAHAPRVGHRPYAFQMSGRGWVTIRGFTIERADLKGVFMGSSSHHVEIAENTVHMPFRYGIQADTCSDLVIRDNVVTYAGDHGIVLTRGTTRSLVQRNESAFNVNPNVRQANGIYMFRAPANEILDNRCHDNQDTGVQIQSGSDGVTCVQNRSWNNGDHGFDTLRATDNLYIGDVAYGNHMDGFSFEGDSHGNSVYDCIATDNGLTTNEADLWVDDASRVGMHSDSNLFWNSTAQPPIKMGLLRFASVADYSATFGLDSHTIQADPRFVAPAAGDLRLGAGSPAIDAADSGVPGWPALDAEGHARSDDPATANTGIGPIAYGDRGALEFGAASVVAGAPQARPPVTEDATRFADFPPEHAPLVFRPNPARTATSIEYNLSRQGPVRLVVCDATGRLVRDLVDETDASPGSHRVAWDLTDRAGARVRAGMYFCVLRSATGVERGCIALVR